MYQNQVSYEWLVSTLRIIVARRVHDAFSSVIVYTDVYVTACPYVSPHEYLEKGSFNCHPCIELDKSSIVVGVDAFIYRVFQLYRRLGYQEGVLRGAGSGARAEAVPRVRRQSPVAHSFSQVARVTVGEVMWQRSSVKWRRRRLLAVMAFYLRRKKK